MEYKTITTGFGEFSFLDDHTVVATANDSVEIDGQKVQQSITFIEQTLPGDYAIILNRKNDYSVLPVEVYKYFASLERLKAIAIVSYSIKEFLPNNMEQRIFGRKIEKFNSIELAHIWLKNQFSK